MLDYSKGKIYTLRCRYDDSLIYVGSTVQPLSVRYGGHKTDSLRKKDRVLYKTINNDWDNWYIELYELIPCNSRMELERREGEVIRAISTIDQKIAGRTDTEYYEDNKDIILEKNKLRKQDYRKNHREEYLKERRLRYDKDSQYKIKRNTDAGSIKCECGGCYTLNRKSKHFKTKLHQNYLQTLTEPITV